MGACVDIRSNNDTIKDDETDNLDLEFSFRTSSGLNTFVSKSHENEISPSSVFEKSLNDAKSVTCDELLKNTWERQSIVEACPYLSPSLQVLKINSHTSSYTSSPSCAFMDFKNIISFDGFNKRICNRYEIGLAMLKAQIQHGADPKVLATHGERSCLMFAVLAQDFDFVKKLVELGVDVNQRNNFGETALRFANEIHRDDISRYLRTQGAIDV